jgi:hypothetical protein
MAIIDESSLAATLDALNDAFFHRRPPAAQQRQQAAAWIAARQGAPGSYADMFAPTEQDLREGIRVYTGEAIDSGAATGHILGEEACRALILLNVPNPGVKAALERARAGMLSRVLGAEKQGYTRGMYCCGKCSVAFWRHLAVGGLADPERRLAAGLRALKERRTDDGKWRTFPFFYTLLALSETELPGARAELRHAAGVGERYLTRPPTGPYGARRHEVVRKALARC